MAATARAQTDDSSPVTVKGRVVSFNRGPNGSAEGVVIAPPGDQPVVQFNLPPDLGIRIMQTVSVGDIVQAVGSTRPAGRGRGPGPGRGPADAGPAGRDAPAGRAPKAADHAVYELFSLTDSRGNQYAHEGPAAHQPITSDGVVTAINYNHDGAADGLQLNNGDLVKVDPDRVPIILNIGDHIIVQGDARPLAGGGRLIEPTTLNGASVQPAPKPTPPEDGPPPPPDGGPPPPPPDPNTP
ncbi:MAG TPA: hypothetical protein VH253_05865 [Phycisphaerae bacterium]|nr:hypothetical protein [Phycisphaerae bacterium]